MKKIFRIEVDCAACAAKIEDMVNKIDGVKSASVNFISQRLSIEAEEGDFLRIFKEVKSKGRKIDADFYIE